MNARYPGWCEDCESPIQVGDPVAQRGGSWVHANCTPRDDDREPCPRCWLTICDCGRDE
jgi:hypothetical protein